jgi:serine/threonine protein kinase
MNPSDSPHASGGYEWDRESQAETEDHALTAEQERQLRQRVAFRPMLEGLATPPELALLNRQLEEKLALVGKRLHGFDVLELVGEGASGRVYRAAHHYLGYPCAVKVLERSDGDLLEERFSREARALHRIRHPNVVSLYDYGRTAEGRSFLCMEWVDGGTLLGLLAGAGRLAPFAAAKLIKQLALGLSAAHDLGLLHRDLKPSNVMITRNGEDYSVKIVDFGLVGAHRADAGMDHITRTGNLLGTPLYMAPEVIRGEAAVPASDLYALGAILYEVLAGRPPFVSQAVASILLMHLTDKPEPIESAFGLDELALHLLSKDPRERPSIESVLDAVDACLVLAEQAEQAALAEWGQVNDTVVEKTPGPLPPPPPPIIVSSVAEPPPELIAPLLPRFEASLDVDPLVQGVRESKLTEPDSPLERPTDRNVPATRPVTPTARRPSLPRRRPQAWRFIWALSAAALFVLLAAGYLRFFR